MPLTLAVRTGSLLSLPAELISLESCMYAEAARSFIVVLGTINSCDRVTPTVPGFVLVAHPPTSREANRTAKRRRIEEIRMLSLFIGERVSMQFPTFGAWQTTAPPKRKTKQTST